MLQVNERIVLNGESIIDGIGVANFQAEIDTANCENVWFNYSQSNAELYKINREQARADQAAFEDMVYALQEKMIAERESVTE